MTPGAMCLCSRGLVHSRTMEAVLDILPEPWWLIMSHDLPIPEAQNYVTREALARGAKWIWYVEEDVVPQPGFISSALDHASSGFDVIAADYPLATQPGVVRMGKNGPVYAGMGCLLVRATVFDRITKPWFEAAQWSYDKANDRWTRVHHGAGRIYGGQDIHFFAQLHGAGIPFKVLPGKCQHLRVKEYGAEGTNDGCHKIEAI